MLRHGRAGALLLAILVTTVTTVYGQDPQPSAVERYLKRVPPPDQGGGIHFAKHLALVFGGIKPGQGIAVGPAISTTFDNGGYAQIKGVYSVRNFRLVQARYDTPRFWNRRGIVVTRVRWQDAPDLPLFRLGIDSPRERAQYGEQQTEVSADLETRFARIFRVSGGAAIERYSISAGELDPGEDRSLKGVPLEPGLSTRPWFTHVFAAAAFDTRRTGYARSGTVLDVSAGDYRDWRDGTYAFQHVGGGLQQFVGIGAHDSVGVSGRVWLSHPGAGHLVPFFLMPTLGGGDALEAFNSYRFRDRDALYLRGEYRHALHEMIDAVGFVEAGTVAPVGRALKLGRSVPDAGAGIIVHSRDAALLRLDVARGRDGFGLTILFSPGGRP